LIAGICPTCGLPKEICVCEDLGRETTQLSVEMDTRRYGKAVTVVQAWRRNRTRRRSSPGS